METFKNTEITFTLKQMILLYKGFFLKNLENFMTNHPTFDLRIFKE